MVHHLTPNLNSSTLNSLHHSPLICPDWEKLILPFLDLSSDKGLVPLALNAQLNMFVSP